MCGIIGLVYTKEKSCTQALIDGLTVLQHRGQDAAGIVTISGNRLNLLKNLGTVADVFHQDNVIGLQGSVGIGHVRYPTAGGSCSAEAQPLYTNAPFGIALAHNGNLTNTDELMRSMEQEHRHINTNSDSELLLNVFAEELQRRRMQELEGEEVFDAVRSVMRRCKGGYAVVMLINRVGLVAFRDPHGIRPLCFGSRQSSTGVDYAVASESVAIDALDSQFKLARDVGAGEAIFINMKGELHTQQVHPHPVLTPCMFEYVYFARPDSVIDGVSVYEARVRMGDKLAQKILRLHPDHDIDIVMPIPETSRTSALQCAHALNRPYREGFIKNRYIARTFIMPGQEMRRKTVRLKLNTIKSEFKDKNVLLVDDSIVRGTTSMELVQMAKEAGAKKVFFASAAPPVRYSNVYGIDIPTRTELIAHQRTEDEIAQVLGADLVIYNDLEEIEDAVKSLNPTVLKNFDSSCFSGVYPTEEITPAYLEALERGRGKHRQGAGGGSGSTGSSSAANGGSNGKMSTGSGGNSPLAADIVTFRRTHSGLGGHELRPHPVLSLLMRSGSIDGLQNNSGMHRRGDIGSGANSPVCESLHNTGGGSGSNTPRGNPLRSAEAIVQSLDEDEERGGDDEMHQTETDELRGLNNASSIGDGSTTEGVMETDTTTTGTTERTDNDAVDMRTVGIAAMQSRSPAKRSSTNANSGSSGSSSKRQKTTVTA